MPQTAFISMKFVQTSRCAVTHCWFSSHLIDTTRRLCVPLERFFFQMSVRLSDPSIDRQHLPSGLLLSAPWTADQSTAGAGTQQQTRRMWCWQPTCQTDLFCFMYKLLKWPNLSSCIVWHSIAKNCFALYNFTCFLLRHAVYVDYLYL